MNDKLNELRRAGHNVELLLKDPGKYMSVAQVGPVTAYETYQRLGIPVTLKELKRIYSRIEDKRRLKGMKFPKLKKERVILPAKILVNNPRPIEELLGPFKVILGITGSGKSNTVAVIVEEFVKYNIPVHIIDVEGEHLSFVKELGFRILNKDNYKPLPNRAIPKPKEWKTMTWELNPSLVEFLKSVVIKRQNLLIDFSSFNTVMESFICLRDYLEALWHIEDKRHIPVSIIVEEVHTLVPQNKETLVKDMLETFAKRGRKRKIEVTFITQRSADADKSIITQAEIAFLHRTTMPADLSIYKQILVADPEMFFKVPHLQRGEVIYVNKDKVIKDFVRKRTTAHGAHTLTIKDINLPRSIKNE